MKWSRQSLPMFRGASTLSIMLRLPVPLTFRRTKSLMEELEEGGSLDPAVESLPDAGELNRRRGAGAGLTRPEVAVVLGYARIDIAASLAGSAEVTGAAFEACALSYFPGPFREAFSGLVPLHPLYNKIIGCQVANEVVDRMGPVWAHEVAKESRRQLFEVITAYWAAREVLGIAGLYDEVDRLSRSIPDDALADLRVVLSTSVNRLVRWYLSSRDRLTTSRDDRTLPAGLDGTGPPTRPANT